MDQFPKEPEERAERALQTEWVQRRIAEVLERRKSGQSAVALTAEEAAKVCRAYSQ